jgi:nucleoid DNA-binding protein
MAKKAAPKAANGKAPSPAPRAASKPADASAPAPSPAAARPKSATKADVLNSLADKTGLGKKEIANVFAALGELVARELGKKGPGVFVLPGMLKLKVVRKPATKAKQGTNPFTKEPMTIKAKPARNVVRAVPLKSLKELV